MSLRPPLTPLIPINDVTGQYIILARNRVRKDVEAALRALQSALVRTDGMVTAIMWDRGNHSTYTGTAARRGRGMEITVPLHDHANLLRLIAPFVFAKEDVRHGFARSLARSRFGGSSNLEFIGRTGLFLDCDDCGPAQTLLNILDQFQIAYIYQLRPAKGRWHIELYFAAPIERPGDVETPEAVAEWTRRYFRPVMGWLLGIFSELGELACNLEPHRGAISVSHLGADGAAANRLIALGNSYCRRSENDPEPVTLHREGMFLDVEALLVATGFEPPVEEPRRTRRSSTRAVEDVTSNTHDEADEDAPPPPDTDEPEPRQMEALGEAVVAAFTQANLVTAALGPLAFVRCPFREGHSTGTDGDTSTAIMPNGFVKCLHGSCASRTQEDFLRALPIESQYAVLERLSAVVAEREEAIFAPSIVDLAARLSTIDPFRFADAFTKFSAKRPVIERWTYLVRKARRG